MIWHDVLLTAWASKATIEVALAEAFAVPAAVVAVVDADEPALALPSGARVAVERFRERGDVRMRLLVHLLDPSLLTPGEDFAATADRLRRLAESVRGEALIAADTLDPTQWLLLRHDGTVAHVELEETDEDGSGSPLLRLAKVA